MNKVRSIPYHTRLIVLSSVGLIASFWQTAEKIHGLKNPEVALSCNINPIVDCGTVLNHPLSSVFGVPNSMLGMIMFTSLLIIGILMYLGVKLVPTAQKLLVGIAVMLIGFSVWFFAVSLYDINKICIFCIFIWTASVPLFFMTIANQGKGIVPKKYLSFIQKYTARLIVSTYAAGIALFLIQFRDYYFS